MLRSLHIENIAVISKLDIEFTEGFSVLTGETGAGKSIIIDSINILLGNKVPRDLIRNGESLATVSGFFDSLTEDETMLLESLGFSSDDGTILLQKNISRDGRSSVRLNGQVITQSIQREIAGALINIHGQNDSQKLLQKPSHISLLDSFAGLSEILEEYGTLYSALVSKSNERKRISIGESERIRRIEMLKYQIADIDSVAPKKGEEERLEAECKHLSSIEKINKQVNFSYKVLYGADKGASAYYILDRTAAALASVSDAVPQLLEISDRLTEMKYEVADIAETVRGFSEDNSFDPTQKINKYEERLDAIAKLRRKYGPSIEAVLDFKSKAQTELDELDGATERTEALDAEIAALKEKADIIADRLHTERIKASETLGKKVMGVLEFLDMSKVTFKASVTKSEKLDQNGKDDVEFLIETNKGSGLMPMIKIASGGELARITLALKSVLADKDGIDTLIFDEIDTGISGKTSRKVGIKLKQISKSVQVICITHSAQIASLSDTHYLISKSEYDDGVHTSVKILDDSGRVDEVARILGGINITEAQRNAACEMIAEGKEY